MLLYLDELQFKLECRFCRMIFGWVMALELVFFVQMFSCPDFFFNFLWDIDLIFGMLLYLDEIQFKFEFRSGRIIFDSYGPWSCIFFQTFSCPDFFLTFYEILIWYLVYSYIQHLTLPLMAVIKICKKCKNKIHVIYLLCNWFPQLLSVCHSTSITSQDCFWKWFEIHVLLSRYLLIYSYI
jgi:hypothetical protein